MIIKINGRKYDAEKLEQDKLKASKKVVEAPKPKKKDVTKDKGAK